MSGLAPVMGGRGSERQKILLIAGAGRSGTTLLDRLLGQLPGFTSLGEFYWFWTWGLKDNQLCGCGRPIRECPFWTEALSRAFGGLGRLDLDRVEWLQRRVEGRRYAPVLRPFVAAAAQLEYTDLMARLYAAIQEVAQSRWIVDSSKFPVRGSLLRQIPSIDLRVVHLVRDSRAVAHSWQRRRIRAETGERAELMPIKNAWQSSMVWNAAAALIPWVRLTGVPYLCIRYEDLAGDPSGTLRTLLAWAGESSADLSFVTGGRAQLQPNHTVAGNPMRFTDGAVDIRPDTAWRTEMAAPTRTWVTLLTFPFLWRHGYFSRTARGDMRR